MFASFRVKRTKGRKFTSVTTFSEWARFSSLRHGLDYERHFSQLQGWSFLDRKIESLTFHFPTSNYASIEIARRLRSVWYNSLSNRMSNTRLRVAYTRHRQIKPQLVSLLLLLVTLTQRTSCKFAGDFCFCVCVCVCVILLHANYSSAHILVSLDWLVDTWPHDLALDFQDGRKISPCVE